MKYKRITRALWVSVIKRFILRRTIERRSAALKCTSASRASRRPRFCALQSAPGGITMALHAHAAASRVSPFDRSSCAHSPSNDAVGVQFFLGVLFFRIVAVASSSACQLFVRIMIRLAKKTDRAASASDVFRL